MIAYRLVFAMWVQLARLARQDLTDHQDLPDNQEEMVSLEPKERQVLQALQVDLDLPAFRDIQVIIDIWLFM